MSSRASSPSVISPLPEASSRKRKEKERNGIDRRSERYFFSAGGGSAGGLSSRPRPIQLFSLQSPVRRRRRRHRRRPNWICDSAHGLAPLPNEACLPAIGGRRSLAYHMLRGRVHYACTHL